MTCRLLDEPHNETIAPLRVWVSLTCRLLDEPHNETIAPLRVCDRAFLEELWRDSAPFADANFTLELPRNLQARFFEMYLTVALLRQNKCLLRRGERGCEGGPDVCVANDTHRVWLEVGQGSYQRLPEADAENMIAAIRRYRST